MSVKKVLSIIMIVMLLLVVVVDKPVTATSINVTSNSNITAIDAGNSTGNQIGKGNAITITSNTNNTANTAEISAPLVNNTASTNAQINNTAVNNKANNTSKNATGLPYTGTSSSVVFVIIALLLSAIYAFKKIRDYNV